MVVRRGSILTHAGFGHNSDIPHFTLFLESWVLGNDRLCKRRDAGGGRLFSYAVVGFRCVLFVWSGFGDGRRWLVGFAPVLLADIGLLRGAGGSPATPNGAMTKHADFPGR